MTQDVERDADIRTFATSVSEVESRAGLNFFYELPTVIQIELESAVQIEWLIQ